MRPMGTASMLTQTLILRDPVGAGHAAQSERPYRSARTHEEARAEVERVAGSQFDSQVAGAFLGL